MERLANRTAAMVAELAANAACPADALDAAARLFADAAADGRHDEAERWFAAAAALHAAA